MDSFRASLIAKLNSDATLTAMLATTTSIYHRRAPLNAAFPYIVFDKQSSVPEWSAAGPPMDNQLWQIKGVDRSPSAARAEDIAKRIMQVLTDPVLTLNDGTLLYMRKESDIDYGEDTDPDQPIHNVGGSYRTRIDRA